MRTDLREMSEGTGIAASRRGRIALLRTAATETNVDLEPLTVDAVFADEMPLLDDRGTRRDRSHSLMATGQAPESVSADDQLLRSLSAQLELLNQQQHEIRRLLDQAGRRRVDRVAT